MDSPEPDRKKPHVSGLLRCSCALIFTLALFISASSMVVLFSILIGNFSISDPISVPSQCKIISSRVDLRSSKICELGFLNYKAKNVFYPSERKKFRCRYDYYWASIFEVEYIDLSGQVKLASAEAPNEALPHDCRPNFGVAWLSKDEFKVNETYDCWYTLGISKVNLYHDGLFNCHASDPSTLEMVRRYFFLIRYHQSDSLLQYFVPIMSVSNGVLKDVNILAGWLGKSKALEMGPWALPMAARVKKTCFLVAYFSFAAWLVIQYGKRIGLPGIEELISGR
uniref:Uncharacterized protein n=1 Tax=Daucus carota subsp. sativus TaxID=79200 RepID=A0A166F4U0_DAUCS